MKKFCQICGVCEDDESIFETSDGKFLCESCLTDEDYVWCNVCDEHHPSSEIHYVTRRWRGDPEPVCEDCLESNSEFYFCSECENWRSSNFLPDHETYNGRTICNSCYENYYRYCADCGEIYPEDMGDWDDDEDDWYCNECNGKKRYIKSYGYKPEPVFKTKHDYFHTDSSIKELLLGVENEIDKGKNPLDTAAKICNSCEDVYIKHDGSLTSDGMEIVTHPCTLEYHMDELGWDSICKIALESEYKSHDARTCGLHVHVGRNQLGGEGIDKNDTIAKIVLLMERHWNAMVRFSRRTARQLSDWAERPNLSINTMGEEEEELRRKALHTRHHGRYKAVNLTNYATIEFRIFNGTLKHDTIKATLQLVSNICLYAKAKSYEEVMCSTWEEVSMYRKYGELQAYLKARGLDVVDNPEPVRVIKPIDEPGESSPELGNLKVGDLVEVVDSSGAHVSALRYVIGQLAEVIQICPSSELPIRLAFGSHSTGLYSAMGHDFTYLVHPYNIRPVEVLDF